MAGLLRRGQTGGAPEPLRPWSTGWGRKAGTNLTSLRPLCASFDGTDGVALRAADTTAVDDRRLRWLEARARSHVAGTVHPTWHVRSPHPSATQRLATQSVEGRVPWRRGPGLNR